MHNVSPAPAKGLWRNATFRVGTLEYTRKALLTVMLWMLGADLCLQLMENLPSIIPLQLKELGAHDALIGFVKDGLKALLTVCFVSVIGMQSDRHRGPLGRRRPFLLWCSFPVCLFLVGLGFIAPLTHLLHGGLAAIPGLGEVAPATLGIGLIAVFTGGFLFFNNYILQVYQYLVADVIPQEAMGTFVGVFRAVGALSGFAFNRWIFGFSETHITAVYVIISALYLAAFLLLVWRVREGQYPPPEARAKRPNPLEFIRRYAGECYTHKFYLKIFAVSLCFWGAWVPFQTFVLFYATQAKDGHLMAQHDLGLCFEKGTGVAPDAKEAAKWYQLAAVQSLATLEPAPDAPTPRTSAETVAQYRAAAAAGDARAQFHLATCLDKGYFLPQNTKEAVQWLRKAAEQGLPDAQYGLGIRHAKGRGVPQDSQEAVKWYRLAANQGFEQAQYSLAQCYANGTGLPKDLPQALHWYRLTAEGGIRRMVANPAVVLDEKTPLAERIKTLRTRVERGVPEAQYDLGRLHEAGTGVAKDAAEAFRLYGLAAGQGSAKAQYRLGLCSEKGLGTQADPKAALKWYRAAAEQGLVDAYYQLGRCLQKGIGTPPDPAAAIKWYRKAADKGYAPSLGVSVDDFGKIKGWTFLPMVLVFALGGPLIDRFHALRVQLVGAATMAVTFFAGFFLVKTPDEFLAWWIANQIATAMFLLAYLAMFPALFPRKKYGQFFSANELFFSIGLIGLPTLCGLLMDIVKDYNYLYIWGGVFSAIALAVGLSLYRDWKRLGGDDAYEPPDTEASATPAA